MAERTIILQPGQCVEDIALQEYGTIDAVGCIVFGNEDVFADGFSTDLEAGTELRIPDGPTDQPMLNTMRALGIVPATNTVVAGVPGVDIGDYNIDHNDDHWTGPDL